MSATFDGKKYQRLDAFLRKITVEDIYPEKEFEFSKKIIEQQINKFNDAFPLQGKTVLDIGCGQGVAIALLQEKGAHVLGVTLGSDYTVCKDKGYDVIEADFSFMDLGDRQFDVIWCRHALEHSIAPYFSLHEFKRYLKPKGMMYIEVPAPVTSSHHENNPNHYSCFTHEVWQSLIRRAGFELKIAHGIKFETSLGDDLYYYFYCTH